MDTQPEHLIQDALARSPWRGPRADVTQVTLAITTASGRRQALALGRGFVAEGLAACATVLPGARSVYRWKGRVAEAPEAVVLIKTAPGRLAAVRRRLKALHAYELPEDLAVTVSAGTSYARWVEASTSKRRSSADRGPKPLRYTRER